MVDDEIFFQAGLSGTITLNGTELSITDSASSGALRIDGGGQITISGDGNSRVFLINNGANATLAGLTITDGQSSNGGGISNSGTLTLNNSTLSGNSAGIGGGISNSGTLTINLDTSDATEGSPDVASLQFDDTNWS